MEPADFRVFLTVAEELHFGRAAARLNITPPPLTRHIQRIERALGARLFDRTRRSVTLTAAGAALVGEARRLLAQLEALPGHVRRAAGGDTGTLRAGVISAALFSQARVLQAALRKAMPRVHVEWHIESSADQVEAVRLGRLDLGFVHTPIEHEGLALRRVMREPLIVALPAGHPLAKRRTIPLRALEDEVFVVATRERVPSYYDRFVAACHAAGFEPKLEHQRQTMINFLGLVAIGAGVTVVPASVARIAVDGTTYVRLSGDVPYSELSVVWSPGNTSPVLARALRLVIPRRR
ncbi:MAG: LysR substrate-binding domain-containing protein [Burkholderiales bacterium]